jgi:hypothetical protein
LIKNVPTTKTRLLLLPLIASLLWVGAGPSQAAGEDWRINGVKAVGCAHGDWDLDITFSGLGGDAEYITRTVVTAGGLAYMNELGHASANLTTWGLFDDFSYGPVPNRGTWPIPAGRPMTVRFTLEQPKGTVLSSWTMVANSCDSPVLPYNGPTSGNVDGDFLATGQDTCPTLTAFTANGCPPRDRTLTLKARSGPRRVVGRLHAAGYPALYAGQKVTIWKARPGPDRKVATRTTNSLGTFKARLPKGRYYATAPALTAPTAGEATADTSGRARVR